MQTPSIGRVVIAQAMNLSANNGADVAPATITRVWGERPGGGWTINVKVQLDGPADDWRTSLVLFDTEDEAREYGLGGCWWPPRL